MWNLNFHIRMCQHFPAGTFAPAKALPPPEGGEPIVPTSRRLFQIEITAFSVNSFLEGCLVCGGGTQRQNPNKSYPLAIRSCITASTLGTAKEVGISTICTSGVTRMQMMHSSACVRVLSHTCGKYHPTRLPNISACRTPKAVPTTMAVGYESR